MARPVLVVLALVEFLFPRRIIAVGESLAFERRGEATLRGWTVPLARLEGLTVLVLLRSDRSVAERLGPLFGLVGLPMVVAPRRLLRVAYAAAYARADEIELRSWVVPGTRLLGIAYLLVGLRWLVGRRSRA